MKLRNSLWAFALAFVAMSCSDDFKNPNKNGNQGNEANGETAKMKVIINTEMTTKAHGEEGDGDEKGSFEESEVKNLNVFLFEYDATAADADKQILDKDAVIVAKGYTTVSNTTDSDHPSDHGYQASIEVTFEEEDGAADFSGKTYGVIAVVNTGDITNLFNLADDANPVTISNLADHLQTNLYNSTNKNEFVMSSHMMKDADTHESYVTFPEVTNAQDVPTAYVFVERLAAKIRISEHENAENFVYEVGNDKIRLDQVAIINQLTSGSYLLKRATTNTLEELTAGSEDQLLIDEKYESGATRFVLDPWTYMKNAKTVFPAEGATTWPTLDDNTLLAYKNHIKEKDSYAELFTEIAKNNDDNLKVKYLYDNDDVTETNPLLLAYTMENTTDVTNSKNGFSTGALFKGSYYAKQVMDIQKEEDKVGNNRSVKPVETSWGEEADANVDEDAPTFYTYGIPELKYASLDAIFAYALAKQVPEKVFEEETSDEEAIKLMEGFYFFDKLGNTYTDNGQTKEAIDTLHIVTFMNSKTFLSKTVDDMFGYLAYLRKHLTENNTSITEDVVFADVKELPEEGSGDLKTFSEYLESDMGKEYYKKSGIKSYENGECYYLYWIRHEDNKKNNVMGPMEFAIVRNNIYDLAVSGISGLGLSGADVPDPDVPDEDGEAKMNVVVKVKNWVVRKNTDIIL